MRAERVCLSLPGAAHPSALPAQGQGRVLWMEKKSHPTFPFAVGFFGGSDHPEPPLPQGR